MASQAINHIIASAPELLAALEQLTQAAVFATGIDMPALEAAHAAILKARG